VCRCGILQLQQCCFFLLSVSCCLQEFRTNMQTAYERCGFMGERVIGFAYKKVSVCCSGVDLYAQCWICCRAVLC